MIRQYYAQRCRGGENPLRVGIIPTGAIFYIQDEDWWRDRYLGAPVRREPWIVEALLNGTVGAGRRDPKTGLWEDVYTSGRSDMAVVRSLRTGRHRHVSIRLLILHEDEGLRVDDPTYPDLPSCGRHPKMANVSKAVALGHTGERLQRSVSGDARRRRESAGQASA